jgi:hypothetical protein
VNTDDELTSLIAYDDPELHGRLEPAALIAAGQLRRRRARLGWAAGTTAVIIAAVTVGVLGMQGSERETGPTGPSPVSPGRSSPAPAPQPSASPRRGESFPADEFVAVQRDTHAIQVRSQDDGSLLQQFPVPAGTVDSAGLRMRDGSILVLADTNCTSTLSRADPHTGRVTPVRTLTQTARNPVLSPDGRHLAYFTWPTGCQHQQDGASGTPQPTGVSAGVAQFPPYVLVVLDLGTGATVSTTVSPYTQGQIFSAAFSPDGARLAVDYFDGRNETIRVVSAATLDFTTAALLHARHGCAYSAPAWLTSGLYAVEGCGTDPGVWLSPGRVVRLDGAGHAVAGWALPACLDGVRPLTDAATHSELIVTMDVGYGDGTCGRLWGTQVDGLIGGLLRTRTFTPGPAGSGADFTVTSW